jgi:hypothetical protein
VAGDFPIEQMACQARTMEAVFNALIVKEYIIRQSPADRNAERAAGNAFGYPNAAMVLWRHINTINRK